jgi:hypothetical protein
MGEKFNMENDFYIITIYSIILKYKMKNIGEHIFYDYSFYYYHYYNTLCVI